MLSALLALAPAAFAQHGGSAGHAGSFHGGSAGHAGYGGFHGGFAGGFRGGYSAARSYRSFAGSAPRIYGAGPHTIFNTPQYGMSAGRMPVYRPAYRPDSRIWGRRGHYHVRHNGYYGYGNYGYGAYPGFANSWELLPWDLDDSDSIGGDTGPSQPAAQAPQPSEQPEYVPSSENGYRQDYYPSGNEGAAPPPPASPIAPEPQLTLIFKDGHTKQIRNYALTQSALLDMDQAASGRMTQIPLSSLNLTATEKAARQAGLDFSPPSP
jgi:hypothetical protein